ncbi:MAG: diketogulonate related aldo/keto reductase [halophilic archaeon J07HX5]|nr:MAG: diketogulonate related aldo/keto reductase [halophilic archaeon J07HX5]
MNADERPRPEHVPTSNTMPMLGLGTWENADYDQCVKSVRTAIDTGYRHIDTAQIYRNEEAVGEGIATADTDRDELFLATKVWISNLNPTAVRESTRASLDRLGVETVDLLYVHWPAGEYEPAATLGALEAVFEAGLTRRIGVSNFEPNHLDRARELCDVPVFANQIEIHPYLPQEALRAYADRTEIELVAYSPLARGAVLDDPTLTAIAADHDASAAQVALAWLRSLGITPIPKATSPAHIRDNWASLTVDLTAEEIARINAIDRTDRRVHPDFAPAAWD